MTMQVIIVVLLSVLALVASSCDNSCSGHGTCGDNGVCQCYEGWGLGLSLDSGDCSQRICPFEYAWVDTPDRVGNHHKYIECSAKGICNRDSGECECFPGYEGKACARTTCPNDCSGHGQCLYLDKEPFKSVIGDYNNFYYSAKYAAALGKTGAVPSPNTDPVAITAPAAFVSRLTLNQKVVVGNTLYNVKSVDSTTSFKVYNAAGDVMGTAANPTASKFVNGKAYALIALPKDNLRTLKGKGTASPSAGAITTAIPHGLKVGDIIYLSDVLPANPTDASPVADAKGKVNVLYKVKTVTDAYIFFITELQTTVNDDEATLADITTDNALYASLTVNIVIPKDALTLSSVGTMDGIPSISTTGQFDVVDPFIDSLTTYIDRKYWDAKKTRACLCDPEYGDVDCSARMCQYGTDVMDSQKDQSVAAKNHIQLISFTGQTSYQNAFSPVITGLQGKTFALTFKTKLNETFSTIPINMPYLVTTGTGAVATRLADALKNLRNFELDVEWALKNLPSAVIDGVKVKVTKPVDTTGVTPIIVTPLTTNTVTVATTVVTAGGTTPVPEDFVSSLTIGDTITISGTKYFVISKESDTTFKVSLTSTGAAVAPTAGTAVANTNPYSTYANAAGSASIPLFSATNVAVTGTAAGGIGGTTSGHNVFEFSVEFSGNNVQGTQHYLTVEAAKCADGCFPKVDGLKIDVSASGNQYVTVVTQSTLSAGMDNDMESDFNSYECGRRGKCDYKTGLCSCFSGYTGNSCNVITALV